MTERVYSLLLVDDEDANRLLVSRRLEMDGHHVTHAEHGRHALQLMAVERFDLVLLDMHMPEMDGLATLDAIKSSDGLKSIPVVMLTAANSREHVVRSLSLGAADYLIKPVNPVELRHRVRRCLNANAARLEPAVRVQQSDLAGSRVMIVDDEPLNLMLLERRLGQAGFKTLRVEGGMEALKLLEQERVDAILLDINMPGTDGFEVLRAVRASPQWQSLPVLMLSADGRPETVERCYGLGANDYLVKPYNTADLHMRLSVAMDISQNKTATEAGALPVD